MTVVFASNVEIHPREGEPLETTASNLKGLVRAWILAWYARRGLPPPQLPEGSGKLVPNQGHTIEVRVSTSNQKEELWTTKWVRPDDFDASLQWSSSAVVASNSSSLEFNLVIRVDPATFEIRPVRIGLRPPRVIKSIVSELPTFLGGLRLTSHSFTLSRDEIQGFVQNRLKNASRKFPCVLVSPRVHDKSLAVNPELLASYLSGLGEVFVLRDRWAAYELVDAVSPAYACYNGAVRVYWPKFGTRGDQAFHPFYQYDVLAALTRSADAAELRVFRLIAEHAALRASPGELTREVERHIAEEQGRLRQRRLEGLEKRVASGEESLAAVSQELRDITADRDEALRLLEQERNQREELQRRIDLLESREEHEESAPAEEPVPETVMESVLRAERDFGQRLILTSRTKISAADSPFRNPVQALRAFEALAELSELYYGSEDQRRSIGPLETFFRARGALDYSAHEGMKTMGKFGIERQVTWDGRTQTLTKHVTLGGGSRENCLQIYWEFENASKKILVGHCGLHLEYSTHGT